MSKIDDLISKYCPNGVEHRPLWEITIWDKKFNGVEKNMQPKIIKYPYLLAADMKALETPKGDVRLLSTGIGDLKYTTEELAGDNLCDGEIVAIPWGGTPNVKYYKGKFVTADNRIATSTNPEILSNKFLYYYLSANLDIITSFYRGAGIQHPNMKSVLTMSIPLPPLSVQQEIVRILDGFAELEKELEKELVARRKQYEYYRNQLVSFGEGGNHACDVKWVKLGDFIPFKRGVRVVKAQLSEEGMFPVYQNSLIPLGFFDKYNCSENTVFIIMAGAAGGIGYSASRFWAADDCYYFEDKSEIVTRYLYHFLMTKRNVILSGVRKASVPRLSKNVIENLQIPLPPLAEQERIVAILDKFDALVNDISVGLPAELKARRKQYEYWRNKLLDFKEAV